MRALPHFLVIYVYIITISGDKEAEEDGNRKRIIEQLTRTRTVLLDDFDLVTRHIATDVYMYRSYRTVSVVFYPVMRDVTAAHFTFQSEELHLNNIGSCSPQEVIVNIKHGSYPAVNPDGYHFPKHFINSSSRESIHTLEILSDGKNSSYTIQNPKPGNWYALIYIKWEDPRTQKVEQQGLVADCQTILYSDLQVRRSEEIELIDCYSSISVDYTEIPTTFKCMAIDSVVPIFFNLTVVNATAIQNEVSFKVQALSIPTEKNYLINCAFDPTVNTVQTIIFTPHPNSWHYIQLDHVKGNVSAIADCESYHPRPEGEELDNHTILDLMRDDKGRFFTFDYGLPTTDLQDATSLVNITSNEITTLRFRVNQFLDIGGSIAIEASLLMSLKYYAGYKREFQKGKLLAFTEDNQFFKVVICMDIGHSSIPFDNGRCRYNDKEKPALFVLNSTDSESIYDKIIIPFPEGGTWYLTVRLFCDNTICPCRTSDNGTKYYIDTDGLEKEMDIGGASWNETRLGTSECNSTVVLSVSSTSCVSGRCSNNGNCLLNTFGGLIMSFCSCSAGYGGWDCSDDSRMDSRAYMLVSVLLLTLSNVLFFFSIYTATIRLYYTEAMMYAFTMVFSTFYHACDAPTQIAYCIVRGNILQFGDFYCGIMSFWVTLLAMSIVDERMRSSLQLIGAIIVALLTTWNMHSFVSFLLPVAVGITVLLISWIVDYRKYKKMRYPRSYYAKHMPFGLVLVTVGLICYAFLQTEQNYKIVHSIWHMIIAVSVVFLLPDVKRDLSAHPFVPSPNCCRLSICRYLHRCRTPIAED